MLAACGGGGGGGGVDPSDGNIIGDTSNLPIIELSLVDNSSEATTSVSSSSPGTLIASVTQDGAAVSGLIVSFSLDGAIGQISPSSGSALTDSSGQARITLNPGTTQGAGTVTASASGAIPDTFQFASAGDGSDTADETTSSVGTTIELAITKNGVTPETGFDFSTETINTNQSALITATLSDLDGNLEGEIVNFTTTQGTLSAAQGLTNSDGEASVILRTASVEGPGTISVSFGSVQDSENFNMAGDAVDDDAPVTITASFLDPADNSALTPVEITSTQSSLVSINVQKGGTNQAYTLVSVDNSGIGVLTPSGTNNVSTIFTDENGIAEITLSAGTESESGNLVIASLGESLTTAGFSVVGPDVQLGDNTGASFSDGVIYSSTVNSGDNVSSGSTHVFSVDLVDALNNNSAITTGTEVTFTSDCVDNGDATIDTPVTSSNGTASATYKAESCEGPDTIRASAQGEDATISFTVLGSDASAIAQSGDASPTVIAIKGTTSFGRSTESDITFLVTDTNGNPKANETVNFELESTTGGIQILNPNPSGDGFSGSGPTDSDGLVTVKIEAGTIPTPVRVVATLDSDSDIQTVSEQLLISTGLPHQDGFSLSLSETNVEAFSIDNYEVTITASGSDRFNNPMPDGTAISFRSENGGRVTNAGEECEISNGAGSCSVTWQSSGTRAGVNSDGGKGGINDRFGRSTVIAYLTGEESFIDINSNGRFDDDGAGDVDVLVTDLPEVFLDKNEDNVLNSSQKTAPTDLTASEEFVDFDNDATYDDEDSMYNGTLCTDDAATNGQCPSLIHVRDETVIVSSTSSVNVLLFADEGTTYNLNFVDNAGNPPSVAESTLITGITAGAPTGITNVASGNAYNVNEVDEIDLSPGSGETSIELNLMFVDLNGNPPASGSTVSLECSVCDVAGSQNFNIESNLNEPPIYGFTLEASDSPSKDVGTFTVTITSPGGTVSSKTYDVVALP
jgi:hypothetical protein